MCVRAGLDSLRVRIAYGMFDTRGRIDPFSPDSPLKLIRVEQFPADFFFVLRVVQVPLVICGGFSTLWYKIILGSGRLPGRLLLCAARGAGAACSADRLCIVYKSQRFCTLRAA